MFFFKQKTAYEMRISDWSSDVCSSDLPASPPSASSASSREDEINEKRSVAFFPRQERSSTANNVRCNSSNMSEMRSLPLCPRQISAFRMRWVRSCQASPPAANIMRAKSREEVRLREIGRASYRERVCQYV